MSHSNISIFVPHLGCPHQCTFCNQKHITGQTYIPTEIDIDNAVSIALKSPNFNPLCGEIAFFGGSFTAIDKDYMLSLLAAAKKHVLNGSVSGIRISTRPDCIDSEILSLLKEYKVSAIELGAQSMCDRVLNLNKRGHTANDVVTASNLIKKFGFELGLQMMTGLYGSTEKEDILTAEKIIELKPNTVRIYPTITVLNTELHNLYLNGEYKPQEIKNAIDLCATICEMFEDANIKVIRLSLHSIDNAAFVAGPWHPAFKELCDSKRYRDKIERLDLKQGNYEVFVSPRDLSKAIGQKRSNIKYFEDKNINLKFTENSELNSFEFTIRDVK